MRARSLFLVAPLLLCGVALAQSSEKIVIDGSTGVMPLAASLATAFQKHEPAVTIDMGKATSWKTLGGSEMPVSARTRPDSEVDAEVARASIACLRDVKMPEAVKVMAKGGDMAKELAATPGSFGNPSLSSGIRRHRPSRGSWRLRRAAPARR